MNKTNDGAHYGFTQYCFPRDYELAEKTFVLTSEDRRYTVRFCDREFVECSAGGEPVLSQYEALKIDDTTHIVFFGERITTAVLDLQNGTAAISAEENGKYEFCTIEGYEACGEPIAYTEDMTGTHVRWFFGCDRYLENLYRENGLCDCIWSPRTDRARTIPAAYIRVKDGIYLVELNSTSPFRTDIPQGFSKIVMLQNYDRLVTVGCIYSPTLNEFRPISGYAMEPLAL